MRFSTAPVTPALPGTVPTPRTGIVTSWPADQPGRPHVVHPRRRDGVEQRSLGGMDVADDVDDDVGLGRGVDAHGAPGAQLRGGHRGHVLEGAVVRVRGQRRVGGACRVDGREAVRAGLDDRDVQDRTRRVRWHATAPGDHDVEHPPAAHTAGDAVVGCPGAGVDEAGRGQRRQAGTGRRSVRREAGQRWRDRPDRRRRVAPRIDGRRDRVQRRLDQLPVRRRAGAAEVHAVAVEPGGLAFAEGVPLADPELRPSGRGGHHGRVVGGVVAGAGDVLVGEPHHRPRALVRRLLHDGVDGRSDRPVVVPDADHDQWRQPSPPGLQHLQRRRHAGQAAGPHERAAHPGVDGGRVARRHGGDAARAVGVVERRHHRVAHQQHRGAGRRGRCARSAPDAEGARPRGARPARQRGDVSRRVERSRPADHLNHPPRSTTTSTACWEIRQTLSLVPIRTATRLGRTSPAA